MKSLITVTDEAKNQVQNLMSLRDKNTDGETEGLKIALKTKGCSGLQYSIQYADEIGKFDEVIEEKTQDGQTIKIIIDTKAVMFIMGSIMDYEETKLESGFKFINPNEKGRCGCGESFTV